MRCSDVRLHYTGGGVAVMEYTAERAQFGIGFSYAPNEQIIPLYEAGATMIGIATQFGSTWRWY